ncbi:hypothetical protein KAR91_11435 [Candidatus Pacearchaeota archaeon]|nr:hypothetical protein [Candidatus Pacearchaeota archaeon]
MIRRKHAKATDEQIGIELGRTFGAIQGMVGKLRCEGVLIPMRGQGVRRLWDSNLLKKIVLEKDGEEGGKIITLSNHILKKGE